MKLLLQRLPLLLVVALLFEVADAAVIERGKKRLATWEDLAFPSSSNVSKFIQTSENTRSLTAAEAYSSASKKLLALHVRSPFVHVNIQSALIQDMQNESILYQSFGNLRGTGTWNVFHMYHMHRWWLWFIIVVQCICLVCLCAGPIGAYYVSKLIGKLVKTGIEQFDQDVLGVDVEIGELHPNVMYGILHIDDLYVRNPKNWDSPYLLHAGVLHIDFDMQALIMSGFQKVEIEKVIFKDVNVIYEKSWSGSNVQDVLDFMAGKKGDEKEEEEEKKPKQEIKTKEPSVENKAQLYLPTKLQGKTVLVKQGQKWRAENRELKADSIGMGYRTGKQLDAMAGEDKFVQWGETVEGVDVGDGWVQVTEKQATKGKEKVQAEDDAKEETDHGKNEWALHEVKIKDVGLRIQGKMLGGKGVVLSIGDIKYEDFSAQVGDSYLDDIVQVLLKSVLKTVLSNVVGTAFSNRCL